MNEAYRALEASGFINLLQREPELEFVFRHALVHDAAYQSLVKQDRRRLHLIIGELLERAAQDRVDEMAPVLAHHFAEAGAYARAFAYFARAGEVAARKYANGEADAHYAHAIRLALLAPAAAAPDALTSVFAGRGRVLEISGRYAEALAHYDRMLLHARRSGDRRLELGALVSLANLYTLPIAIQDFARSDALSTEALALARALSDDPAQARILWNQMRASRTLLDLSRAIEQGEQSLAIARRLDLREQLAFTLNDISEVYLFAGQTEHSRGVLLEASLLWRELNNLPMLADNLGRFAALLAWCSEFEAAVAVSQEVNALSQRIGNAWGQATGWMFTGTAYLELGRPDLALAVMEQTITLAGQIGFLPPQCLTRAELARLYAECGDTERALSLARSALASVGPIFDMFGAGVLGHLAHVQLLHGDAAAAHETLRSREIPAETNRVSPVFSGMYDLAESELALAMGNCERALALADDLLGRLARFGITAHVLPALCARAQALHGLARPAEAHAALLAARERAVQWNARWSLQHILTLLAGRESEDGRPAEAQALRAEARELAEQFAARLPDERLRATFRGLPAVRALSQ